MKPRIAIPVPTSTDIPYNQRSWPAYAKAIAASGGEPVEIDITQAPAQILALARTCQGICLPGSPADVDPAKYGADIDPATSPADPAREAADNLLLEHAASHAKPVLGICFGLQSLNVWRGGSLVQDLTPLPVNHSAGSKVAIAHTALVAENTLLASLLDPSEAPAADNFLRLPINTSHHQSVSAPGDGLRIVARCPDDGVVEAVENDPDWSPAEDYGPQFLLGVQWHPERSFDISPTSRNLFTRLVTEAAKLTPEPATTTSDTTNPGGPSFAPFAKGGVSGEARPLSSTRPTQLRKTENDHPTLTNQLS
jgi:putative glutamine amidotransferase